MTTSRIFEYAQLSEASYADFIELAGVQVEGVPTEAETRAGLVANDFTEPQIEYFIANHRILHYRPNTPSGFAAILVGGRDATSPDVSLVLRGTELFAGFLSPDLLDAGLRGIATNGAALDQIVDLYNYWQRLTSPVGAPVRLARISVTTDPSASGIFFPTVQIPSATYRRIEFFDSAANSPDSGLGIVTLPVNLTLAGHSLGGHLAIAFERLFSLNVLDVYVVSSAGFRNNDTVNRFFDAMAGFTTEFHPTKITNLAGSAGPNVVAGELIYEQIGERATIHTETALGNRFGHASPQMTDSAAVHDLFVRLDVGLKAKTASEAAVFLLDIFRAASPGAGFTLESVVNMLGKLFVPAYTEIPPELKDNRAILHQQISLVRDRLPLGVVRIEPLLGLDPQVLAGLARGDIAYRYALRELNPFALIGANYSRFESELVLYNPATDDGFITDAWLEARAKALATKIAYNTRDGATTPDVAIDDRITGLNLVNVAPAATRLVFGGPVADSLTAGPTDDRIFGGAGADTISTGGGQNYVEGGDGTDTINAGWGDDEVYGGLGNDTIDGSLGADKLYGGMGEDTIDGGLGDDIIYGDRKDDAESTQITGDDTINGGAGTDQIWGGGGNDTIRGGDGNDTIEGNAGDDKLYGEDGSDSIRGGSGKDLIVGGRGADTLLDGGDEADVIYGDEEDPASKDGDADTIRGGADKDEIYAGGGNDIDVDGEAGDDLIVGGHGNDVLRGGEGADTIYGGLEDPDDRKDLGTDQLHGDKGDDKLYGGNGRDLLYGGEGNDELRGGAANDRLEGGTGFDRYIYEAKDGRDIIKDESGAGHAAGEIEWERTILTGGRSWNEDDLIWYDDPDNWRFTYQTSGDPNGGPVILTVTGREGGFIEIRDFLNHDLKIDLNPGSPNQPPFPSPKPSGTTPPPSAPSPVGAPQPRRGDPLVLDLDGLGISTLGLGAQLHFDHDGDGFAERTGWVGAGAGVLILDLDDDGRLSNGQELFGDFTRLAGGLLAVNGFAALSAHDRNADGAITAADPIWSSLRVGSFDTDESGRLLLAHPSTALTLATLEDLGVTALGLGSAIVNTTDAQGNTKARTGTFALADRATQELAEYRFARDPTQSTPVDAPIVSEAIAALPRLQGGAQVLRLHEALELDSRPDGYLGLASGYLRGKLDAFLGEADLSAYYARFEELLAAWAGVEGIPAAQLRGEIPARQIAVLERFYGQTLAPNPHHWQSFLWQKNYRDLAESLYGDLLAQTHFADHYEAIELVDQGKGRAPFGNLMPVIALFDAEIAADPVAGQALVNEFGRGLRGRQLTQSTNYFAFREHFLFDAAGSFDEAKAFAFDAAGKPVPALAPGVPGQVRSLSDYTESVRAVNGDRLIGNGGDDVLYGDAASTQVTGGAYDNTLYGGAGDDPLQTGAGNDIADGGPGNDTLHAGAGDDVYLFRPGGGHDSLGQDPGGFDTVFFGGGLTRTDVTFEPDFRGSLIARIVATGETLAIPASGIGLEQVAVAGIERFMFADGSVFTSAEIFAPTQGPDTLLGANGNDTIDGLAGDDRIVGYAGNDVLIGGEGDDLILGGSGDDVMEGGPGNDRFDFSEYLQAPGWWYASGNNHNDTYRFGYGDGQDVIHELQGTDTILFKPGVGAGDLTLTNQGFDLVIALAGSADRITVKDHFSSAILFSRDAHAIERLQFADGTVLGAEALATATLTGTPGDDELTAFVNANTRVLGLDGDDRLVGNLRHDILEGGAGNDWLISREGNDQLFGGDGDDRLTDEGSYWIAESNTLDGGAGNDWVESGFGDDLLRGGEGDDLLSGGHGGDVYIGGPGNDVLTEPLQPTSYTLGADVFVFGRGDGHDRVTPGDAMFPWWQQYRGPKGEIPSEHLRVDDVLRLREGISPEDVTVFGERVQEPFRTRTNARFAIAGDPDSSITLEGFLGANSGSIWSISSVRRIEFANGTVWSVDDVLERLVWQGTDGDDRIYAGMRRDLIRGEAGDDVLYGFTGDDRIYGGAGDDFIDSGDGNDFVDAGEGDDRILTGNYGSDVIDPGAGDDRIGLWSFEREEELLRYAQPTALPGNTAILFGSSYGNDVAFLPNARADSNDTIRLAAGLTPADVKLVRAGDDLVLRLPASGDALTVRSWFRDFVSQYNGARIAHPYRIETVEFGDGTRWGAERILAEVLIGTDAGESLRGYDTDDLIEGRAGADDLFGSAGDDILDGGAGNDYLLDPSGADVVRFGRDEGSDTYERGYEDAASTDTIEFKPGLTPAEVIVRRAGEGYAFGISDTGDALRVHSPLALEARFADGTGWSFDDIKARAVLGTAGDDELVGFDDRPDRVEGRGGNDLLTGGAGDDTYVYDLGDGFDVIFDAAGDLDTLAFATGITLDELGFASSHLDLVLTASDGGEVRVHKGLLEFFDATMPNAIERIAFADGTSLSRDGILARVDRVILPGGIFGTENDDLLEGNEIDNQIFALEGDDAVFGGEGDDTLDGGSGNDDLHGDEGDDTLLGGEGDDALRGGPGRDELQGRAGSDRYFLEQGSGFDTVIDEGLGGGATRGERFPEALDEARRALEEVLGLNGDGTYFSSIWGIEVDGGWAADIPEPFIGQLISFGEGVFADEAEQILREFLAWLGEPDDGGRIERFPEAIAEMESQLGELHEYTDDAAFFTREWLDLRNQGRLEGIPKDLVDPLFAFGEGEGVRAAEARDALGALDDWFHATGGSSEDSLDIDAAVDEVEIQVTGNRVAIGIAGTNDAILIRPIDDDGSGGNEGEVPELAVQRFLFADGNELSPEEIVARADDGVIGEQQDFLGASFLRGSVAEDAIYAHDGDDDVDARASDDFVSGGQGEDRIAAGSGDDTVDAGEGDDIVAGGRGNDQLAGGEGSDVYAFNYGDGDDVVDSAASAGNVDTLSFGADVLADDIAAFVDGEGRLCLVVDGGEGGSISIPWFNPADGSELASRELRRLQFIDADGRAGIFDLDAIVSNNAAAPRAASAGSPLWLADTDLGLAELTGREAPAGDGAAVAYAQEGDLFATPFFGDNESSGGADQIIGSDGDDFIEAGDGDDTVSTGAGDDFVFGGAGDDILAGGAGSDELVGEEGDDVLIGGSGDDYMYAGTGEDLARGGDGHDTYRYERGDGLLTIEDSGENTLEFGPDILFDELTLAHSGGFLEIRLQSEGDLIRIAGFDPNDPYGTTGASSLYFDEEGAEYGMFSLLANGFDLIGTDSADSLPGTALVDRIKGGDGGDSIRGGASDDLLDGGLGADTYYFEIGDGFNTLIDRESEFGQNSVEFGAGIGPETLQAFINGNSLYLAYSSFDDALLMPETALGDPQRAIAFDAMRFADGSSMSLLELLDRGISIVGTPGADRLLGTAGADSIGGLEGDDFLSGGGGEDAYYIDADSGVDTIDDVSSPGEENSLFLYAEGLEPEHLTLSYDASAGTLDILLGTPDDAVKLAGFDPQDPFGNRAIDGVEFASGQSLSYAELLALGITIRGTDDSEALSGTAVRDWIHGGGGDDYIDGTGGGDFAFGGAG